jgi:hypothetical protein
MEWPDALQDGFRNRQAPARPPSSSPLPPAPPPPESAIEAITVRLSPPPSSLMSPDISQNLGFDRQQAISALRATNNNVEAAANHLFSGRD